jgi:hypothetical protein
MTELDDLREEFATSRIGPRVYALLGDVVRAGVVSYPPAIYSPSQEWDAATLTDLLHDWCEQRLLRGHLEVMLRSSANFSALRAQLMTSFTQMLINGRRRDSAANLYKRVVTMLTKEDELFEAVGTSRPSDQQWRLRDTTVEQPATDRLEDLVRFAFQLSDAELAVERWSAVSLKSSPILREPALRRFLTHLFSRADGTLTPTDIARVMSRRFQLTLLRTVEIENELDSGEPPVELAVTAADAADAVIRSLRLTDIEALRALHDAGFTVSRAAQQLGCSEGRISGARGRLVEKITELADTEEESKLILRITFENLFL